MVELLKELPGLNNCLQEVSLYVVTPPYFGNTSESEVRLLRGTPASMFCEARGEPKPTVTWKRSDGSTINLQHRGGQLESFGSHLQLGKLTPRDTGDYECVAENGYPPAIVKKIRLNVMCKC